MEPCGRISQLRRSKRPLLVLLALLALWCGCAGLPRSDIEVLGVVFHNTGSTAVERASIRVPRTGGGAACGFIPSGGECSTTFSVRRYRGYPVVVTWVVAGQRMARELKALKRPSSSVAGIPLRVHIVLDGFAAAEVVLAE
jgi:hypothetical protein